MTNRLDAFFSPRSIAPPSLTLAKSSSNILAFIPATPLLSANGGQPQFSRRDKTGSDLALRNGAACRLAPSPETRYRKDMSAPTIDAIKEAIAQLPKDDKA